MRNKSVFNFRRCLPCMSWSPRNLYNLWRRTAGPMSDDILFKKTSDATLFQQRWKSKAAVRAYHGDYIPEKVFKRWYLPDSLPDVRPRRQVFSGDNLDLELYARRKLKEKQQEEEIEEKGLAPVGSLMFIEVERRIDTIVFRSCFAHSIYEARRLIIHGDVMLNGKKHTNATTRLAPGDMISVNPEAIRFFKKPNGEYDDINGGENRIKLTPIENEVADEAKTDAEESSLEPQTTSESIEDEVADEAKTDAEESSLEPQTTSESIEDEVADEAKTDAEESSLEPQTTSESIEDEVADEAKTDAEQTPESSLEPQTTSESIEDEVADEAKTDAEQTPESPLEPQTTSESEDEVADEAKTDVEQTPENPLEPQTTSESIEDEVVDKVKIDGEQTPESPLEFQTTSESKTGPKPKSKSDKTPLTPFYLPPYASPWLFIPAYIEPSFATCSAVYVRHPTARPGYSEIPTPYDADGTLVRYAWEWYMQRRPRMRSKSQLSRMPEDRTKIPPTDVGEERRQLMLDVKPSRISGYGWVKDLRKYARLEASSDNT